MRIKKVFLYAYIESRNLIKQEIEVHSELAKLTFFVSIPLGTWPSTSQRSTLTQDQIHLNLIQSWNLMKEWNRFHDCKNMDFGPVRVCITKCVV